MLKKTVTYTDYNDVERTEELYFHFNKAEVMEFEMSEDGGLSATIQRISQTKDVRALLSIFKKLVLESYGVKSADGKRFMKSDEIRRSFLESEAYPIVYMELLQNTDKAIEFVEKIMPADLVAEARKNPQYPKTNVTALPNNA